MWKKILDFLLPNPSMCVLCEQKMDTLSICDDCLERWVTFAQNEGQCQRCGAFGRRATVCDVCRDWPKYYVGNTALLPYTDTVRDAVLALKFHQEPWRAEGFAPLFERMAAPNVDMIVPVPLHKERLRERGYNQSLLLARVASAAWGIPVREGQLLRTVNTKHQIGLSNTERHHNVADAFSVSERQRARLDGASVLLIDDVMTTGATLLSCARTLHKNGASMVRSLTLTSVIQ